MTLPPKVSAQAIRCSEPVDYLDALDIQKQLLRARQNDRIPDTFLLVQHTPTITLGRRGRDTHLLLKEKQLREKGIQLHKTARGGDITYHAPGQWVLYPIVRFTPEYGGARKHLWHLEETAIRVATDYSLPAFRRPSMSGAWCPNGKFAAIGFAMSRRVSWHGLSLNVRDTLNGFDYIVGCGLEGEQVTNLEKELSTSPNMDSVGSAILEHYSAVSRHALTHTHCYDTAPQATTLIQLLEP